MKKLMIALLGILLIWSMDASVQAAGTPGYLAVGATEISWTPASENTDGSPYTNPESIGVYCKPVSQVDYLFLEVPIGDLTPDPGNPARVIWTIVMTGPGAFPCASTTEDMDMFVTSINTRGSESLSSNTIRRFVGNDVGPGSPIAIDSN